MHELRAEAIPVMPEIIPMPTLQGKWHPRSLSFLAVILGTVSGGILSYRYHGQKKSSALSFSRLAGVERSRVSSFAGARRQTRSGRFPPYLYGPLFNNVAPVRGQPAAGSPSSALRASRSSWHSCGRRVHARRGRRTRGGTKLKTSAAWHRGTGHRPREPAADALGAARRIPARALGPSEWIIACAAAGLFIETCRCSSGCIVAVGFFTGFYIVPLFTLLQHRAPKASKGDMIATSNCVNHQRRYRGVAAFFLVVFVLKKRAWCPSPERTETTGELTRIDIVRAAGFSETPDGRQGRVHRGQAARWREAADARPGRPAIFENEPTRTSSNSTRT